MDLSRATELCTRDCFSKLVAFSRLREDAVLLTSEISAAALLEPAHMKAAKLEMHAAVPTRHCNICCVAVLLLPQRTAGSEGATRPSGAPCFDMSGCEYVENGDIPTVILAARQAADPGRLSR